MDAPTRERDGQGTAPAATRQTFVALLTRLRGVLLDLFARRRETTARQGRLGQRRLLLGLEVLCKIEEQVLLPAVYDVDPDAAKALGHAGKELDLMRDVALLVDRTVSSNRQMVLDILEGLATLHFARIDVLLQRESADAIDWAAAESQTRSLLSRWHAEVATSGDIEDEDRDPVGEPPR